MSGGTAGGMSGGTAGGMSGGTAGGMSGGTAGGMSGGTAGGMSGGTAGGMSGGTAGGMAAGVDGGVTAGTGWGTTFDAGGLLNTDGGLRCFANPRVRRLFARPTNDGSDALDVAVRDGQLSVQLLATLARFDFNEVRLTLNGADAGFRSFGTSSNLGFARRAYDPITRFEAFAWSGGVNLGSPSGTAFRVLSPQWTGPAIAQGPLTTKHQGVAVVFNPVQREWVTFSVFRPSTFEPDALTMTRRAFDGGLSSTTTVADGGLTWNSFPLTSFVWTGSEFMGAATRGLLRIPADGGLGVRAGELSWSSTLVLAPGPSEIGVLIRATDGGALYFNRVSPSGVWQQPVATLVSPVEARPIPTMVWDGQRFRVGFSDDATDQPWTAAVSAQGILESFEPLGCELGTIWNEPRFAVVDAGFVVSTFQSTNETGILQLP
jgi:hypothetical protein